MYQPEVKLEFVRRYFNPKDGWKVYVDIDASEEGRTGGERKKEDAIRRQKGMKAQAKKARKGLDKLGVQVNGGLSRWIKNLELEGRKLKTPDIFGDRDIVAININKKKLIIAEVEGVSSGQPEQKLYKAIGQIVMAVSQTKPNGWKTTLVIVVYGEEISKHLSKATCLKKLALSGLSLNSKREMDEWFF